MYKENIKKCICLAVIGVTLGTSLVAAFASNSKVKIGPYGVADTSKYEVLSNRHTQYVEAQEAVCQLTTEGFVEKMNNGTLSVWYNKSMEALRIVDLRSGYVWGCIDDKEEYELNKKWTQRATSMLYISYFDFEGKEESCALSDKTFDGKFDWKQDGFSCKVSAKKLGISFTFTGKLEKDSFSFAIDDKSIEETGKSKLGKLSFVSFMGSVYENTVPGYILVPDGSGALIRFQETKAYQSGYRRKVYGSDLGIEKASTASNLNGNRTDDYATEENQLSFPLWGMVHGENQNGFLATIDSGELYTYINAIPAGAENQTVRFSRAYAEFVYRDEYNKRVSNNKVVLQPQEMANIVNPKLTYTFLTDEEANYSVMARKFREKLLADNLLPENTLKEEGEISLFLHVAGSEVQEGFLANKVIPLTNVEQATGILDELNQAGIKNVSMAISGWNKGGYHGGSYGKIKFEGKVGTESELQSLQEKLKKQGGSLSLVVNPMVANEDQINVRQDVALNATLDEIVESIPNDSLMYQDTYYVRNNLVKENIVKMLSELQGFNILMEDVAKYLHSDYTINNEKTRTEILEQLTKTISSAKQNLIFDAENLYMLKYASQITDIPVSNSQYVYETDSVPFLQMVLRGSVDYYAPYSNLGFYSNASVLKMIEYGAYPSFMVMNEDNFSLSDTPLENYFSLNFKDWEEKIQDVYSKVNGALSKVKGASIINHNVEAEGVYSTTYDNGVTIFVNYNSTDYVTEESVTVPANGYIVEE